MYPTITGHFYFPISLKERRTSVEMEKAIQTAISYETNIRDIYRDAAQSIHFPEGRRFFKMMGDDEQYHLDYLKERLKTWQKTGELSVEKLDSIVPSKELIQKETEKIKTHMAARDLSSIKVILGRALQAEVETSRFYEKMVKELTRDGQQMFARFLEIEENHIAAVQAELDYITHTGYWFNFKEFDMEEL
jgi:rubrerythrin